MGLPPDAEAVLHQLADSGGSGRDLAVALNDLLLLATQAVPSCLGVTLTISRHNLPVTITVRTAPQHEPPVLSSLAVQLPAPATEGHHGAADARALTLYAAAANAFAGVAANLLALLDLDPRRALLDGHLELPPVDATASALKRQLDDVSDTDLALGALLDKGMLLDAGRRELERLASLNRTTTDGAARLILAALRRPQPEP